MSEWTKATRELLQKKPPEHERLLDPANAKSLFDVFGLSERETTPPAPPTEEEAWGTLGERVSEGFLPVAEQNKRRHERARAQRAEPAAAEAPAAEAATTDKPAWAKALVEKIADDPEAWGQLDEAMAEAEAARQGTYELPDLEALAADDNEGVIPELEED